MPAGLRWRLAAWVAGVMLVSAAVVFLVVYHDTGSQLQGEIDRDIIGDTSQLISSLQPLRGQSPARIRAAATAYVHSQPYTATSSLLFVLAPGASISNHPEVFGGGRQQPGESEAEQSREDAEGVKLLVPRLGYSVAVVPDVGRTRIFEQGIDLGTVRVVAGAGEPLALVGRAQHDVARAFVLAAVVVLMLALLAFYLAGARESASLRRMA